MDRDDQLRGILVTCKDKCFSKGTDYRCNIESGLARAYAKNEDPNHEYLATLQKFMYSMSKLETPTITVMDGRAYGSGAVFGMLGHFPMTTPNTNVCFPETGFGFVPTGGSTFFLSRMPDHIGLYVALTGNRLLGADLIHLQQALGHVDVGPLLFSSFSKATREMFERLGTRRYYGDMWAEYREHKFMLPYIRIMGDLNELKNRTNTSAEAKYWKKHRENLRMVLADIIYKQMLQKDADPDGIHNYREFKGQPIVNHLVNFENHFISQMEQTDKNYLTHQKYRPAILRCFSASSLEELWKRLELEEKVGEKEWAKFTKEQLKQRAPLALAATFKLVKDAENLQWHECLEREFTAAARLASHPDFFAGVTTVLSNGSTPTWKSTFPVSQDQLAELWEGPKLDLGAKHNELLPNRDYFRKVPSSPRLWMNELSSGQQHLREDYEFDVQHFFNAYDIDVRNTSITQALVRRMFYNYYFTSNRISNEVSRIQSTSRDMITRQLFISLRETAIHAYFGNEAEAKARVQQLMEQAFLKSFRERIEYARTKSEEAHKLEKNKFLRELKEMVSRSRLVITHEEEMLKIAAIENQIDLILPMTFPKGDEKNYLDEMKVKLGTPMRVMDFFSVLEYKQYLLASPAPEDASDEINFYFKDLLSNIYRKIGETISDVYTRLDPSVTQEDMNKPTTLIEKQINVEDFAKLAEEIQSVVNEDEEGNPISNVSDMIPELLAEVYVKFGAVSIREAKEMISKGATVTIAAMKARRRQLIEKHLTFNSKVPHPEPETMKMKKMFTELYVEPDDTEINDLLAGKLEIESAEIMLEHIRSLRYLRRVRSAQSNEQEESDEEQEEEEEEEGEGKEDNLIDSELLSEGVNSTELMQQISEEKSSLDVQDGPPNPIDMASSVLLDHIYLEAAFGDKAYLPGKWSDSLTDAPKELVQLGCYSETPEAWVTRALSAVIAGLMKKRAEVEKYLTKSELASYDQSYLRTFEADNLKRLVLARLYEEANFLRYAAEGARDQQASLEHSTAQLFKPPNSKPQDINEIAEDEAIKYSMERKKAREINKPKQPLQFDMNDELAYMEVRKQEQKDGYKSQMTPEELEQAKTPVPHLSVQQEHTQHRDMRAKLTAKEERLVEGQKTIAALQLLVKQQNFRKKLKDPEAVEAFLKSREAAIS